MTNADVDLTISTATTTTMRQCAGRPGAGDK